MRYNVSLSDGSLFIIDTLLDFCVREVPDRNQPEIGGEISIYPLSDIGNYIDLKQLPSDALAYLMARKLA